MYDILRRMHREGGPFYYRIESTADAAYQSRLAKAIDMHFAGRMINSPNDYDVVIKLIPVSYTHLFVEHEDAWEQVHKDLDTYIEENGVPKEEASQN